MSSDKSTGTTSRRQFLQRVSFGAVSMCLGQAYAQPVLEPSDVLPMGNWLEYRQANYTGNPILVHLRIGYERVVLMPEDVTLEGEQSSLPGCEIIVEGNLVGFYPTSVFDRQPIRFVGSRTADIYELRVRASSDGIRQPLQINRQ